ncbi:predicted protein [Pyrenophora tritici-repentis Pt-1C-BFP]|uniref:Uncharacterized protein n=1 Tax=Pyrenophora tritici-repentis (strain Pt-1C-BFP) TaxID=426418 RepID=B2VUC7_PYRTR|nr:uncharacterized protein PTRG_02100 [Pyrenophora tritici-repentis Pt-1C-BFP]EDU41538.1 predicted protein [Pyrenophora tritici-repentis Pt-1C-BFP]
MLVQVDFGMTTGYVFRRVSCWIGVSGYTGKVRTAQYCPAYGTAVPREGLRVG